MCFTLVATKTLQVTDSKYSNVINYKITNPRELDYEVLSFIKITANWFSLKPFMVDNVKFIVKVLLKDYHTLCNSMVYENLVISAVLYSLRNSGMEHFQNKSIDKYVEFLYPEHSVHKNTVQIYSLYQTIEDLFADSWTMPVNAVEERKVLCYN